MVVLWNQRGTILLNLLISLVINYNSGGAQNCCFAPEELCLEVTMKTLRLAQITLPVLQHIVLVFRNVGGCLSVSMFSC